MSAAQMLKGYCALSPEGKCVEITHDVFQALWRFLMDAEQPSGHVTIQCHKGGVTRVESTEVRTYRQ